MTVTRANAPLHKANDMVRYLQRQNVQFNAPITWLPNSKTWIRLIMPSAVPFSRWSTIYNWRTETSNHRCMAETPAVMYWQDSVSERCRRLECAV